MQLDRIEWNADGLVPVVIADARTNEVLTLAWANREALERTLSTRSTHLYSRSRAALWQKGESSGNTQQVVSIAYDCDADALLYRVIPSGPACHTGHPTCFHNMLLSPSKDTTEAGAFIEAIAHLEAVLEERKNASPDSSYVAKLYAGGVDKIGKKIGEEATEVVIAAKNASSEELIWESSDLLFHLLVLLKHLNVPLDAVGAHLLSRARPPASS
ncbi:MAG: bifunctional phosphoribosyl-AMP cyclohydrolase/phosphoribosyl-ATP diphosphatase HisIE [Vulcanimicrobiaceae bacterium]